MSEAVSAIVIEPAVKQFGPATWSYDILMDLPEGGVRMVFGVVPFDKRPNPDIYDAESVEAGTGIHGIILRTGEMRWYFNEQKADDPCDPGESPEAAPGASASPARNAPDAAAFQDIGDSSVLPKTHTALTNYFDLNIADNAFVFSVAGFDEFRVHPEQTLGATTTSILKLEISNDGGANWENPSGGATTISVGSNSAKQTVEAPLYRLRVDTAGGGVARVAVHMRSTT